MDRISKLTDEQNEMLQQRLDFWMRRATSVAPLDPDKIHKAVENYSKLLGIKPIITIYKDPTETKTSYGLSLRRNIVRQEIETVEKLIDQVCRWRTKGIVRLVRSQFNRIPRWSFIASRHAISGLWHSEPINFTRVAAYKFLLQTVCADTLGDLPLTYLRRILDISKQAQFWHQNRNEFYFYQPPDYLKVENGQFHCADGPVMEWENLKVYMWRGTIVEENLIMKPITIAQISKEHNIELRRCMIERMGYDVFLKKTEAKLIQYDDVGMLYEIPALPHPSRWMETLPIRVVKVKNSTPEPNGKFKSYVIPVPLTIERARQGIAWTFGLEEQEYDPAIET